VAEEKVRNVKENRKKNNLSLYTSYLNQKRRYLENIDPLAGLATPPE
jgi:hypothetical protein